MQKSASGADERPAVAEGDDEERETRRNKNVGPGSRAGGPKKETESSTTRAQKALDPDARMAHALQKGLNEDLDIGSMVEIMSDQWRGDEYVEIETGAASTNVKTHHGSEEWHTGSQMRSGSGAMSREKSFEGRRQQARIWGSFPVCPNWV